MVQHEEGRTTIVVAARGVVASPPAADGSAREVARGPCAMALAARRAVCCVLLLLVVVILSLVLIGVGVPWQQSISRGAAVTISTRSTAQAFDAAAPSSPPASVSTNGHAEPRGATDTPVAAVYPDSAWGSWSPGNCEPHSAEADIRPFAQYCWPAINNTVGPPSCRGRCALFGTGGFDPSSRAARVRFVAAARRRGQRREASPKTPPLCTSADLLTVFSRDGMDPEALFGSTYGPTGCRFAALTPAAIIWGLVAAHAATNGSSPPKLDDPVVDIVVVGDSLLRGAMLTLVAMIRRQTVAFDRMLHGSFRYTVSVHGDSLEFAESSADPPPRRLSDGVVLELRYHYIGFPLHVFPFPSRNFLAASRERLMPWLFMLGPQYQLKGLDATADLDATYNAYFADVTAELNVAAERRLPRLYFLTPWYDDHSSRHVSEIRYRNERYSRLPGASGGWARIADTIALTRFASNVTRRRDSIHYACTQVGIVPTHVYKVSIAPGSRCDGLYERLQWLQIMHHLADLGNEEVGRREDA